MAARNCYAFALGTNTSCYSYDDSVKPQPGGFALAFNSLPNPPKPKDVEALRKGMYRMDTLVSRILDDGNALKRHDTLQHDPVIKASTLDEAAIPEGYFAVAVFVTQNSNPHYIPETNIYHVADYHVMKFNPDTQTWQDKLMSGKIRDTGLPYTAIDRLPITFRQCPNHGKPLPATILTSLQRALTRAGRSDLVKKVTDQVPTRHQVYTEKHTLFYVKSPGIPVQTAYADIRHLVP